MTEWKTTKLVKVVDAAWGDTSKTKSSYVESGYTAFSAAGPDGFLDYFDYHQDGIVLSAIGANCGKVYFATGKWSCIKNTMRFLVKDENELSIKFLYYALSNPNAFVRRGSGQPFIRQQDVRDMVISYPPLPEQQKIVEILEDHLSRLDAALVDVKQAKEKAAQFRRSLLQAAFTGNLTSDGTRLMTELPAGWESKTMGEVGRYLNGKAFKSTDWKSAGRPIIRIQNLTGSGDDFNYFQGDIEDRYVVMPGDLLFSWSATLGTYIWKGPEAVLNQHIFKVESFIDSKFHRYLLDFKIQEMISKTHGSGMVHITKKSFDAIEVGIPPLPEQQKIVGILEDHLSRLDAAVALADAMEKQSASLRRALLQAAFTGQLTKEVASV